MAKGGAIDRDDAPEGRAKPGSETNRATVRVLRVLSEFATGTEPLGVTEIAERLEMSKNMVFRALTTLVDQGYLIRTESGRRYELGYRTLELNNPDAVEPDLRSLAHPVMSRMQVISGETVVLGLRAGNLLVVIDGIEANTSVRARAPLGSMLPLHASPGSRSILAFLSNEEIETYLREKSPLVKLTPHTLSDPADIWKDVHNLRKVGYALGFGDATAERRTVAFPIFDGEGRPWGAIVVGGPRERFSQQALDAVLPRLQACMDELNEQTRLFTAPVIRTWGY